MRELRRWTAQLLHAVSTRRRKGGGPPGLLPVPVEEHGPEPGRMIVVCAWCGRFRVGATWVAAIAATDLERTSHGICPACFASLEDASCATRG